MIPRSTHHARRGTEKLIGLLGRDVVDKFRALDNLVDIAAWKIFCEEHPSKVSECLSSTIGTGMPIRPATLATSRI